MSGRDLLRRAAVGVLLLGVAGLVAVGLRLTDFDATDTRAAQNAVTAAAPAPGSGSGPGQVVRSQLRGAQLQSRASTDETLAVRELLTTRAHAVLAGDSRSWAVTTPYDRSAQTRTQEALYARLAALHPVSWAYTDPAVTVPAGETGGPGERKLSASFQLKYSLIEGGPTVTRNQSLTVTGRAGRWWVSDVTRPTTSGAIATTATTARSYGSATTPAPAASAAPEAPQQAVDLWDLTPVLRMTGDRCVVIGSPRRKAWVKWFAARCGAAARTVDAAVPGAADRPARTVLVVPADLQQLARLLGRSDTAGLARTAAVTIGRPHAPAEAVLTNADAFAQLRGIGRRVVLTHELVHVATRATQTADVPIWLDEGLADEIAYRDTGLSATVIAGPAIRAARAGRLPQTLPTAADFDAAGPDTAGGGPAMAYAQAWSAADAIVAEAGLAKLVQLHHLVGTGTATDAAFQQVLGSTEAAFMPVWRQHLRTLSRG